MSNLAPETDGASRGVVTRRIRRRAKNWQKFRPTIAECEAGIARTKTLVGPNILPAMQKSFEFNRSNLLRALARRNRDGDHMRGYWREQVMGWLRNVRAYRVALPILPPEMQAIIKDSLEVSE